MADELTDLLQSLYPYDERYGVLKGMPEKGMDRQVILAQMKEMAKEEDRVWESGKCSGTAYCGDHSHYDFINECANHFTHTNALQRDMCPSQSRFESEITAMTLELFHGDIVKEHNPDHKACAAVTSGGSESIMTAVLVYREKAQKERGITSPEIILPETSHVAFNKGAHLFGIKVIAAPCDPVTTRVDIDFVKDNINDNTIALVGSAGNYPYGTIDPIDELSELAVKHNIGLHVDGCLGGFILPWGEQLGYDIPVFDFRLPGVTSISADTHKYGYGLKGTSVVMYRDVSYRHYQYFIAPAWQGGTYVSPGIAGSRSGGMLAATWASMASMGKEGYKRCAKQIFETAFAMQEAVRSHSELIMMGDPTFCFSFRSDEFNVYHVNDFMKEQRGWRFNGQQFPDAIHMCVTRPQTQPGLVEAFVRDLTDGVAYAKEHAKDSPRSAGLYGGSGSGDIRSRSSEELEIILTGYLDLCDHYPF